MEELKVRGAGVSKSPVACDMNNTSADVEYLNVEFLNNEKVKEYDNEELNDKENVNANTTNENDNDELLNIELNELKTETEIRKYVNDLFDTYGVVTSVEGVENIELNNIGNDKIKELYIANKRCVKLVENEIKNIKKRFQDKKSRQLVVKSDENVVGCDYLTEIQSIQKLGLGDTFKNKSVLAMLQVTEKGVLKSTQSNYTTIVKFDNYIQSHIKYNELKQILEFDGRPFTDADYTIIATYLSSVYNLENRTMLINSITPDNVTRYNPVKDVIERDIDKFELKDGKSYIDNFFEHICNRIPTDEEDAIYQREVARMIFYGGINRLYNPGCKFDYMPILVGPQGCVDCDTEYFNGKEWKKISEYSPKDKVLIYHENGKASLEYPERYLKQKQDKLWHIKSKYGIDQCLSDLHNVVYISSKGKLCKKQVRDIINGSSLSNYRFISAFNYSGKGINLSNEEIRLMVACFADGSIAYKKMRFHLKKKRKQERIIKLLQDCNIEYSVSKSANEGYLDFYFYPPLLTKHFPSNWYNCSKEQFQVIADEVMRWDGYNNENNDYSTTCKKDADFIQFVFNSLNYYASIHIDDRRGEKCTINGIEYTKKSIAYTVHYSPEYLKMLNHTKKPSEVFKEYKTRDGFEYCFTVSTGMLILRRNNCVFVTGNCGKSSIVDWLNPIRTSFVDLRTIDGKEAIELIQGGFVIELSELLAFVRSRDAESMKSFVTRSVDKYRPAYARLTQERPRTCILIGTTNDAAFLTDITGNRRYLPIGLYDMSPAFIYDNLDYVKDYINNCWKEALVLMKQGKTYLHIPYTYSEIVKKHQEQYTLEDPLFADIREYVSNPEAEGRVCAWRVCAKELYIRCLNGVGRCPASVLKQLMNIMNNIEGWTWDTSRPYKMGEYKPQKCWVNYKMKEEYGNEEEE